MIAWGKTDKGKIRPTNQDAFFIDIIHEDGIALIAICDGMGGANAGHIASQSALEGFVGEIKRSFRSDLSSDEWERIVIRAVNQANIYVFDQAKQDPEFEGMGTTLVAAVVMKNKATIINVGDSRAYILTENTIEQITHDHSFVEKLIQEGHLTEMQARNHPKRNLITQAVGVEPSVEPDLFAVSLKASQQILLCSDGLVNMLTDNEVLDIVTSSDGEEEACERLIAEANKAGGTDNITVILMTL